MCASASLINKMFSDFNNEFPEENSYSDVHHCEIQTRWYATSTDPGPQNTFLVFIENFTYLCSGNRNFLPIFIKFCTNITFIIALAFKQFCWLKNQILWVVLVRLWVIWRPKHVSEVFQKIYLVLNIRQRHFVNELI